MTFVLAWTSGHTPPEMVYYRETQDGHPATTYDRSEADRFKTEHAALQVWRSMHVHPEKYEACIKNGSVRAELDSQPELCL